MFGESRAASWRELFNQSFALVVVQLPGYTGALNNGTGSYPGGITSEMVSNMRIAQEKGVLQTDNAEMTATYDLSCALNESFCPFSSVHTPDKVDQGARVALHLRRMLLKEEALVVEGPRATDAVAMAQARGVEKTFKVSIEFAGGSEPFYLHGTRNCTTCCNGAHTIDLDASVDGHKWVNSSAVVLKGRQLTFSVALPSPPKVVRHTAASIFPQCALYNKEGLPALPFQLTVQTSPPRTYVV